MSSQNNYILSYATIQESEQYVFPSVNRTPLLSKKTTIIRPTRRVSYTVKTTAKKLTVFTLRGCKK